jgi:ubiquinone/menaquinone biosynthesis C-methylase UbiE
MRMKPIHVPDSGVQRAYRVRLGILAVSIFVLLPLLFVVDQGVQTIRELTAIELARDQWQRPSDILQALNLQEGSTVADLGSGVGYFTLKLSPIVGNRGSVIAVDILREPLIFLRIRALLHNRHNIRVILGTPDDPRLPSGAVDAVLVLNTYHELTNPQLTLDALFRSLKPNGRLVVVDHDSRIDVPAPRDVEEERHELPLNVAESEIRHEGFEILTQQDHFIDQSGEIQLWWLIVAQKAKS